MKNASCQVDESVDTPYHRPAKILNVVFNPPRRQLKSAQISRNKLMKHNSMKTFQFQKAEVKSRNSKLRIFNTQQRPQIVSKFSEKGQGVRKRMELFQTASSNQDISNSSNAMQSYSFLNLHKICDTLTNPLNMIIQDNGYEEFQRQIPQKSQQPTLQKQEVTNNEDSALLMKRHSEVVSFLESITKSPEKEAEAKSKVYKMVRQERRSLGSSEKKQVKLKESRFNRDSMTNLADTPLLDREVNFLKAEGNQIKLNLGSAGSQQKILQERQGQWGKKSKHEVSTGFFLP